MLASNSGFNPQYMVMHACNPSTPPSGGGVQRQEDQKFKINLANSEFKVSLGWKRTYLKQHRTKHTARSPPNYSLCISWVFVVVVVIKAQAVCRRKVLFCFMVFTVSVSPTRGWVVKPEMCCGNQQMVCANGLFTGQSTMCREWPW